LFIRRQNGEKKFFFLENEILKIFFKISTKIGQNQLFFPTSANIAQVSPKPRKLNFCPKAPFLWVV